MFDWCCFPCCLQSIEVLSQPEGTTVGTVEQEWALCGPKFVVKDGTDTVVLRIEGPALPSCGCCGEEFSVFTPDGRNEVGQITKQWSGYAQEAFTDADNFGISFPLDLDVNIKATLLAALFLIDYMYFESMGKKGK